MLRVAGYVGSLAIVAAVAVQAGDELDPSDLELWPLPPAGEFRLLAQWTALGMPESYVVVDGAQLREAAAGTQKYWPEEGTQE